MLKGLPSAMIQLHDIKFVINQTPKSKMFPYFDTMTEKQYTSHFVKV